MIVESKASHVAKKGSTPQKGKEIMSIAFIFNVPGMTQEQYETTHQQLGNPLEQGALIHIAGPMEGGWRIVEVWPSQEAADRFFGSQRVQQVFQNTGAPPIQPIVFPVYRLYASP
jgi:quinol monooxygenase YgiN